MFEFAIPIQPTVTNNQAEYEALLRGLQYLKEAKAISVEIDGDSELVIKQLNGQYECRNDVPRNLGGGETYLTESSSGRLEFMLSHIRFD
jgi:ribonuclease HI